MFLCLRVDLDYVPWDADEFGHGEPAMVLRLLDFCRSTGLKLHFFASHRSLRAFPSLGDAILGEGHHLDWLCVPGVDFDGTAFLFRSLGQPVQGFATVGPWFDGSSPAWLSTLRFASVPGGGCPPGPECFPALSPSDLSAIRSGSSLRNWADGMKSRLQATESGQTVCLTARVIAKADPRLQLFRELTEAARTAGIPVRTLRDVLKAD